MSSKAVAWGVVGVLAALFIYWQYTNYAHNNQLNADLGNRTSVEKRANAAEELIDKKQFGDVLPTTPEYVHERIIYGLAYLIQHDTAHPDWRSSALGQLTSLMKDSDLGVRVKAQRQLVALGATAIGIDAAKDDGLIQSLKDGDRHARNGAVAALDAIARQSGANTRAVIAALVNAVVKDKDERGSAVDALVGIAPAPNAQMLKLLSDKDKDVQSAAAKYFGDSRQKVGEAQLLALLQNKDVRPAAMRAEGLLGDMRALPEMEKALGELNNRRTAIVAIGDLRALSAIPQLIPFLNSEDPDIRAVTVVALRSMGAPGLPALQAAFASPDPGIRRGVADSLGGETTPGALALLDRALHDPDAQVRATAASSLGVAGHGAAVPYLVAALGDPSPDVAEAAEASLVAVGAPAIEPLVGVLASSGTGDPTAAAVRASYASDALSHIGDQAAPAVIAAAQQGPEQERKWAVVTLRDLRTQETEKALQAIARGPDTTLRTYALDSLRHYGAGQA